MDSYVEVRLIGFGETVEGKCHPGTAFGELLEALNPPTGSSTRPGGGHDWFWMNAIGQRTPILVVPQTILANSDGGPLEFKVDTMMTEGDWNGEDDLEDLFDPDEDEDLEDFGSEPVYVFSDEYPAGYGWHVGVIDSDGYVKLYDDEDGEPWPSYEFDDVEPARLDASYSGRVVSKGTQELFTILTGCFQFQQEIHAGFAAELAEQFGPDVLLSDQDTESSLREWFEYFEVWFNRIAPIGHYFGTLEGNSSEFGFWPMPEPEEAVAAIEYAPLDPVANSLRDAIQADLVGMGGPIEQTVNYWDTPEGIADMAQLQRDAWAQTMRQDSSLWRLYNP